MQCTADKSKDCSGLSNLFSMHRTCLQLWAEPVICHACSLGYCAQQCLFFAPPVTSGCKHCTHEAVAFAGHAHLLSRFLLFCITHKTCCTAPHSAATRDWRSSRCRLSLAPAMNSLQLQAELRHVPLTYQTTLCCAQQETTGCLTVL